MLKKLIKHEWKSTSKIGVVLLLVIAGMTLFGTLGVVLPVNYIQSHRLADGDEMATYLLTMTIFMSVVLYIITFVGVTYGMTIYQGVHFYKTMYSEEGYLTHTLPVTPRQLLVSKTLVAGIWYLLVGLGIILSIGILLGTLFVSLIDFDTVRQMRMMESEMREMLQSLRASTSYALIHAAIYIIMAVIITPFSTMMMLFGSLTVGQLSRKYRAFIGILVYIGVVFVNSILGNIIRGVFSVLGMLAEDNSGLASFLITFGPYDTILLLNAGLAVAFYFISQYILKKKLNLE